MAIMKMIYTELGQELLHGFKNLLHEFLSNNTTNFRDTD